MLTSIRITSRIKTERSAFTTEPNAIKTEQLPRQPAG